MPCFMRNEDIAQDHVQIEFQLKICYGFTFSHVQNMHQIPN
jgi:hypothetical protein